jgi:hypothetical protein
MASSIDGALEACPEYIIRDWMTFPQVVSMCTFAIGAVGLAWSVRRKPQEAPRAAPGTVWAEGAPSARRA